MTRFFEHSSTEGYDLKGKLIDFTVEGDGGREARNSHCPYWKNVDMDKKEKFSFFKLLTVDAQNFQITKVYKENPPPLPSFS